MTCPRCVICFRRFNFREIELAYSAQKKAGKRLQEVLITNFA